MSSPNPTSLINPPATHLHPSQPVTLPRVVITFCAACRWNLRAAYFAQELLSTFPADVIGEVALRASKAGEGAGVFTVDVTYLDPSSSLSASALPPDAAPHESRDVKTDRLWDYKSSKSFPETKVLKQLLRDRIQPGRGLGHSDRKEEKDRKDLDLDKSLPPPPPVKGADMDVGIDGDEEEEEDDEKEWSEKRLECADCK